MRCVGLLAIAACGEAKPHAVAGVAAPGSDLYELCRAMGGHITHDWKALPGASGHVTGKMYFSYLRTNPKWRSVALVAVGADHAVANPADGALVRIAPRGRDDDTVVFLEPSGLPPLAPGADVPFELAWTPQTVEIRIGDRAHWKTVPLASPPTALQTSCSSADVVFHAVTMTAD